MMKVDKKYHVLANACAEHAVDQDSYRWGRFPAGFEPGCRRCLERAAVPAMREVLATLKQIEVPELLGADRAAEQVAIADLPVTDEESAYVAEQTLRRFVSLHKYMGSTCYRGPREIYTWACRIYMLIHDWH